MMVESSVAWKDAKILSYYSATRLSLQEAREGRIRDDYATARTLIAEGVLAGSKEERTGAG